MDEDSLNFGSPAAAATPNSNLILAHPSLQGDAAHSAQDPSNDQGEGANADGIVASLLDGLCHYIY
jgi:SWI/SNF related-matrix-associated actin-dependent regulator of chromatin subfamily C